MNGGLPPRILIVGSQHGDERLGARINRFLKSDTTGRYATVDYLCGNPRAFRRNVRFTETDLNRSYAVDFPKTYEEKRAQKIMRLIAGGAYDYVIDVHTSRADVGRFFLATHLDGAVRSIIGASCFDHVAIVSSAIAGCSLIGNVPQAISIEYDRRLARKKQTLQEIVTLLDNLLSSTFCVRKREVFYISGHIPLDCPISYESKNFERSAIGFYPVIFTQNGSYTKHKGFAAYKKEVIDL